MLASFREGEHKVVYSVRGLHCCCQSASIQVHQQLSSTLFVRDRLPQLRSTLRPPKTGDWREPCSGEKRKEKKNFARNVLYVSFCSASSRVRCQVRIAAELTNCFCEHQERFAVKRRVAPARLGSEPLVDDASPGDVSMDLYVFSESLLRACRLLACLVACVPAYLLAWLLACRGHPTTGLS